MTATSILHATEQLQKACFVMVNMQAAEVAGCESRLVDTLSALRSAPLEAGERVKVQEAAQRLLNEAVRLRELTGNAVTLYAGWLQVLASKTAGYRCEGVAETIESPRRMVLEG